MSNIRLESSNDAAAVRHLLTTCFPTDLESRLVELLRSANRLTVSLVAEDGATIVGHVAFSPVTTASGAVGTGLAPLAVAEPYRRRGIGEALVRGGLAACRAAGIGWCVVLGDPAYHSRFGFLPAPSFGLSDEYGGRNSFQILELSTGAMPVGGGVVTYAPEFGLFA